MSAIGALVEAKGGASHMIVIRLVPILFVDHCSGECMLACSHRVSASPWMQSFFKLFPHLLHLVTNDRGPGNVKCEKIERALMPAEGESRLRTSCSVHRAHTVETLQHDLTKLEISGLIQLALTMRGGQALSSLRRALKLYFRARLRIKPG